VRRLIVWVFVFRSSPSACKSYRAQSARLTGMQFDGEFAVGFLDFQLGGRRLHLERIVVGCIDHHGGNRAEVEWADRECSMFVLPGSQTDTFSAAV
jgi:hypothetical protein